jgi:hypothetical protein
MTMPRWSIPYLALVACVVGCSQTREATGESPLADGAAETDSGAADAMEHADAAALCEDGGPGIVLTRQYDESCTRDDDCVTVYEGSVCTGPVCNLQCPPPLPECANAAINRKDLGSFNAATNRAIELFERSNPGFFDCGAELTCLPCGPVGCDVLCFGAMAICEDCRCVYRSISRSGDAGPPGNGCPTDGGAG